jgi:hypothetical protein
MPRRVGLLLPLALCVACSSPSAVAPSPTGRPDGSAHADAIPPAKVDPTEGRTVRVALLAPAELSALDASGFGLSEVLALPKATTTRDLSGTALGAVFEVLRQDVLDARRAHPTARVTPTLGTRLFEPEWLASTAMRFELVGVFNRLDRRSFYEGSCGEVRFVYRLAYEAPQGGETMAGRLPLTLNVVFLAKAEDCGELARGWLVPEGLSEADAVRWLREEGALGEAARAVLELKSLESNLQTVRIQSTAHPSMAGHVEYSLRVFHRARESGAFSPAPLENSPDVAALSQDVARRAALLAWLRSPEALLANDEGRLHIPEEFDATSARSVSPRGLLRHENRPFAALFTEADFADLDLARFATIRSPAALLRRLDGQSCAGCHQSRSIAGFHHVGEDDDDVTLNALAVGSSPHLLTDLARRALYVAAVAKGETPPELRPSSERQGQDGGFGAPCGLGDEGFQAWTCGDGLRCAPFEDPHVGVCLDDRPVGAPCETGRLVGAGDPEDDRVLELKRMSCGELECWTNKNAFPMGSCRGRCERLDDRGRCLDFVDTDALQGCLIQGKSASFCGGRFVYPFGDRACDRSTPCRQDFVCARTEGDRGACLPPYFMVPLRLDGYPLRTTRDLAR